MSLLRRVRGELSGALRSMRYDMGRRPVEPPAHGPDVTSTGMNTFGGHVLEPDPARRPPRRVPMVAAFGVLTIVAAAGAYLGVVRMLAQTPAAADTFPPGPAVTSTFTPNAGIGGGPATMTRPGTTLPKAADAVPGPTTAPAVAPDPADPTVARNASPIRTTNPTKGECACGFPPVPTPTAPATSPSTSPSGGPSDSPYPSDSGDPSPSETSATPSDSAEPSDSPQARHHRRHH